MTRSFTPQDFITLPKVTAQESVALILQMETLAKGADLPDGVRAALADLAQARAALEKELGTRMQLLERNTVEATAADHALDVAWSAAYQWLNGWARSETEPFSGYANTILEAIFPDGLSFVNASYPVEWTESNTRITRIQDLKLDVQFEKLGGRTFLERIVVAHEAYGKVLGITDLKKIPPAAADVRTAMEGAHAALRQYVAHVATLGNRNKPETFDLAERLLSPLSSWAPRRSGGKADDAEPAPVEGAPGGAKAPAIASAD